MRSVRIRQSRLSGTVSIPSSKSAAHRAILCAALAKGTSLLKGIGELSEDLTATLHAVRELGAVVTETPQGIQITGISSLPTVALFDCCESGSTLRFLIPLAAALGIESGFTGKGRLPQRPLEAYAALLPAHGVFWKSDGGLPLDIRGQLSSGLFELPGNISSQYITGLLLALPLLEGDSTILLSSPLQSAGYVEMTLRILHDFGVTAEPLANGWHIRGGQHYRACTFSVEGDWSQAAFFLCAGALGLPVSVMGLREDTAQGDRSILTLLQKLGAEPQKNSDTVWCPKATLHGAEVDFSQTPDLFPAFAVTAAFADGETHISGAGRLRLKESDRLHAVAEGLKSMGAELTELPDGLILHGGRSLHGARINGCGDHRIVMAFCIAGMLTGNMTISGANSINKSYPGFFRDIKRLGGDIHVI